MSTSPPALPRAEPMPAIARVEPAPATPRADLAPMPIQARPAPQPGPPGRELELKFQLAAPAFKAAQDWPGWAPAAKRPRVRRLLSVYFDTADGDLERNRAALRLRRQGRRQVLTFKWNGTFPGGPFERGEVEAVAASPEPAALGAEVAAAIARLTQGRTLLPVYATDIRRMTRHVVAGASEIEVAFDVGAIASGDRTNPVREIEMELKSGDPADLYALGLAFAAAFPARVSCQSKAERGALLRSGRPPPVVRASPGLSARDPAPTVDEAIGAVIGACLGQFLANWPAFDSGDKVAAVHQMRVAMRRLRSVLGLFQRFFPSAECQMFRVQARDIAAAMAEARNWDVFIDLVRLGPAAAFPAEPGFAPLLAAAERRRAAGYEAAGVTLSATGTTRFVLSLQAFVARRGWRNALPDEALPALAAPARDYAATALARLHHKAVRRGRHLASLPPARLHDLRKDLKQIRYVLEPFGSLLDGRRHVSGYARALAALQDRLGRINDLVTAQDLVARLDHDGDPAARRAAGIVMGWCGHDAVADDPALRKAWKAFRKTDLFA